MRQPLSVIKRREERQNRLDKRRQLVAEKENQENAAEALILLGESTIQLHVDNETQTCQAETTEVATQTSSLQTTPASTHPTTPVICYVPVESGARSAASTFTIY